MKNSIKRLLAVVLSIVTMLTMLPTIPASAYTTVSPDEFGGSILLKSSSEPLHLVDNLYGFKFLINGEIGYCIDPDTEAQKTYDKTVEVSNFSSSTIKLDPNTTDIKEKALISGISVFYAGHGDYFSTFSNGGKTAKSIMDSYIDKYSNFFEDMDSTEDKYRFLTHFVLSQLYHEMIGDDYEMPWSKYDDIKEMIDEMVDFAKSIANNSGDWSAIKNSSKKNNYFITQPQTESGKVFQHLIVRIPKKSRVTISKSNASEEIKSVANANFGKEYLNFNGAQYTLYKQDKSTVVAVAEFDTSGNICKVKYDYADNTWITSNYIEVDEGTYYFKETKAPSNGKYALDSNYYQLDVTESDIVNETTISKKVTENPIVKLRLQKSSSCTDISEGNSLYSLAGAEYAVYTSESAANRNDKSEILGYFKTDENGYGAYVSTDGITWNSNTNGFLQVTYQDSLCAKEIKAPQGFKLSSEIVKFELYKYTNGGFIVLEAKCTDEPYNDPIRILVQKENAAGASSRDNFEGAEFTVKYFGGYYYSETELAQQTPDRTWVLKTNENGYCTLSNAFLVSGDSFYYTEDNPNPCLPLGTISVQETKAPDNGKYEINPEVFIRQIKVDEITQDIITTNTIIVKETEILGKLTIAKSAEDSKRSNNTAKDVWFNVKSDDGLVDTNVVTVASSSTEGAVTLDNLAIYKDNGEYVQYTITELGYKNADGTFSVPDRYVKPEPKVVTLEKSTSVYCYFNNRLEKTGLIVQKKSEDGIVSGFYFSVVSDDGKVNRTVVTGEDGTASLTNLSVYNSSSEKIKYTITELGFKNEDGTYSIPDRYFIPSAKTVTLEDGKSITVTIYNSLKRGSVELTKTDAEDNILKGITFELYNSNNTLVELVQESVGVYRPATEDDTDTVKVAVTDDFGGFLIDMLLPGDYYFVEVDSNGYMPYSKKIEFTISAESTKTLEQYITVKNNKIVMADTGGKGSNREIMINIGYIMLAVSILTGGTALFMKNKKKHSKKAQ